jgi:uncharacterized small protein (DUF1192 family)
MGRRLFPIIIAILALIRRPSARGADDDLEQFKAQMKAEVERLKTNFEQRIEPLEKRIGILESEKARSRQQKTAASAETWW